MFDPPGRRIIHDPSSGNIWFDADGSGPTPMVHFAIITAGITLAASDFTVI